MNIRANYIKKEQKWIRVMQYYDKINKKWEEFNKMDWYNLIQMKGGEND